MTDLGHDQSRDRYWFSRMHFGARGAQCAHGRGVQSVGGAATRRRRLQRLAGWPGASVWGLDGLWRAGTCRGVCACAHARGAAGRDFATDHRRRRGGAVGRPRACAGAARRTRLFWFWRRVCFTRACVVCGFPLSSRVRGCGDARRRRPRPHIASMGMQYVSSSVGRCVGRPPPIVQTMGWF